MNIGMVINKEGHDVRQDNAVGDIENDVENCNEDDVGNDDVYNIVNDEFDDIKNVDVCNDKEEDVGDVIMMKMIFLIMRLVSLNKVMVGNQDGSIDNKCNYKHSRFIKGTTQ